MLSFPEGGGQQPPVKKQYAWEVQQVNQYKAKRMAKLIKDLQTNGKRHHYAYNKQVKDLC